MRFFVRGLRMFAGAAILTCASFPAIADAPLRPPERIETLTGASLVVSDPDVGTTIVYTPGLPDWTVPGWHRFWSLSGDERAFLAIQPGGNLISSNTPETLVFTVHYRNGCPPGVMLLGHLMDGSATLPRSTSHYVLYSTLSWDTVALAWRLTMGNGQETLVYPERCAE